MVLAPSPTKQENLENLKLEILKVQKLNIISMSNIKKFIQDLHGISQICTPLPSLNCRALDNVETSTSTCICAD